MEKNWGNATGRQQLKRH